MIRFGHPVAGLERLPLTAALGRIYASKLTGTLKVYDSHGTSVPFVFWFKRGFPCHSYSRDGVARLGDQIEASKRGLVQACCQRHGLGERPHKQMMGQLLLSEACLTMEELQVALSAQLTARLLCCSALSDTGLEFDEGMDEFGIVPLSSPLLNPIEAGARSAGTCPHERMRAYLLEHLEEDHVQLARDRRIPPAARNHLANTFLESLTEPQDLARIIDTPSRLRTLVFLHAFGFVEPVKVQTQVVEPEVVIPAAQPATELDSLAEMADMVRRGASHYELLGLPLDASRPQVKQVYRHAAFLIHPDRVAAGRGVESQTVFPKLVEAYHALSKERLRVKYDAQLMAAANWRGLGTAAQVNDMLANRYDHLTNMGLTTLAGEYHRMITMLQGGVAHQPADLTSKPGHWWQ
jgi:hypothetical protein